MTSVSSDAKAAQVYIAAFRAPTSIPPMRASIMSWSHSDVSG